MIHFSYSKGNSVNYDMSRTEKAFNKKKRDLEADGYVVKNITLATIPQRDLVKELEAIGLTTEQCKKVMSWADTLPIHIYSGEFISVRIQGGIVRVESCKPKDAKQGPTK